MKTNYHGHTRYCNHGTGEIEDHIKAAIDTGLEVTSISEHVPFPEGYTNAFRMKLEDTDWFMDELERCKEYYKDDIKVLKAFECEYITEFIDHYKELKSKYNLDFLILGHHYNDPFDTNQYFFLYDETHISRYVDEVIEAIKTELFDFIAHPDIFVMHLEKTEGTIKEINRLLKVVEQYDMPIEFNANGFRHKKGYPKQFFWEEVKKYNIRVLINSDAHEPKEVYDQACDQTYALAAKWGIKITEYIN